LHVSVLSRSLKLTCVKHWIRAMELHR